MATYANPYEGMPGGAIGWFESNPGGVFQQWLSQFRMGQGAKRAMEDLYYPLYTNFLYASTRNPQSTPQTFGEYLGQQNPFQQLAKFAPEQRGFDPRRFYPRVRTIPF